MRRYVCICKDGPCFRFPTRLPYIDSAVDGRVGGFCFIFPGGGLVPGVLIYARAGRGKHVASSIFSLFLAPSSVKSSPRDLGNKTS